MKQPPPVISKSISLRQHHWDKLREIEEALGLDKNTSATVRFIISQYANQLEQKQVEQKRGKNGYG